MCFVISAYSNYRRIYPPINSERERKRSEVGVGVAFLYWNLSLRQTLYSSLHHFTVPDQHKKWVSGVGGREKGDLWGREEGALSGKWCSKSMVSVLQWGKLQGDRGGVAIQMQPVYSLSPVFQRKLLSGMMPSSSAIFDYEITEGKMQTVLISLWNNCNIPVLSLCHQSKIFYRLL